ncbi:hypothetical protein V2J09_016248 [Rumex salicifolius]
MANYDLTPKIAPHLDRHLEREFYSAQELLKAKIELLNYTNMVDYTMDIHKVSTRPRKFHKRRDDGEKGGCRDEAKGRHPSRQFIVQSRFGSGIKTRESL